MGSSSSKRRARRSSKVSRSMADSTGGVVRSAGETKKYRVWFRHSGEPAIDHLPGPYTITYRELAVEEIVGESQGHDITHMWVKGEIPPLLPPTLTHLGILNLTDITHLVDCLSALVQLQVLEVWSSHIGRVPDAIPQLTTLKQLKLWMCGLTALPGSLSALQQLEVLDVSDNDFSPETIAVVGELSELKKLDLSACNLAELPDSFSKLTELEELDISNSVYNIGKYNTFVQLPPVIYKMRNLRVLKVSHNSKLQSMVDEVLDLHNLTELNCDGCESMTHPPYSVSQQGLSAIRKYFLDLKKGQSTKLTAAPIAIVGNFMAGKTSLVRTLQQERRVVTNRDPEAPVDEATRVFEVQNLSLGDSLVKVFDYGGHSIYHLSYQLITREECVPTIVVNMKEFSQLATERGSREATRRVCFDWLSHLYLACPRLDRPLLVLTHVDLLTSDQLAGSRADLLREMENIRHELLEEESLYAQDGEDYLSHMIHFSDKSVDLIRDPDHIFQFGKGDADVSAIRAFKSTLEEHCHKFQRVIPQLWDALQTFIEEYKEKPYITLDELSGKYPKEDCDVILKYMHNTGRVLWFDKDKELSNHVFHQISAITDMISLLFHHSSEVQWKNLSAFSHKKKVITPRIGKKLVHQFLTTGVINEALLGNLLATKSQFGDQLGITIMKCFRIIHGPIEKIQSYIVPYFATEYLGDSMTSDKRLLLRSEILLLGLSIPAYGYHMVTVEVLNITRAYDSLCKTTVAKNGALIVHGHSSTNLVHDFNSKKIVVQIATEVPVLAKSWKLLLDIGHGVLTLLAEVWKAARAEILFFCAHCLFLRDPHPFVEPNPDWFCPEHKRRDGKQEVQISTETFTGVEPVICERHSTRYNCEEPTVPRPLMAPCYELTSSDLSVVNSYLESIEPTRFIAEKVVEPSPIQQPVEEEPVTGGESPDPVQAGPVQPSGEDNADEEEEGPGARAVDDVDEESDTDEAREAVIEQPTDEAEAGTGQETPDPDMTRPVQASRDNELAIIGQQPDGDLERFCDMRSADNIIIDLPLQPVERDDIKQLYYNTTEVYRTSAGVRARFLIINVLTGLTGPAAEGCKVDADNLKKLFSSLEFDQSNYGVNVTSWTAQRIYDVIESETRHPDHQNYGMFVLAILCHGGRGDRLADCNNQPVDLMNIKDLLNSQKFPAMRGKPKLVIMSACSGSRQDFGDSRSEPQTLSLPFTPAAGSAQDNLPSATALNADDFLLMKGSSESYTATVFPRHGTWFIRVLVITFYQYSSHWDVESLFKIIQHRVRKLSMEHESFRERGGNVPSSICTFTNFRKLFLFPGYSPPPQ